MKTLNLRLAFVGKRLLNMRMAAVAALLFGVCFSSACSRTSTSTESTAPGPDTGLATVNADDVDLANMKLSSPDGGKNYQVAGEIKNNSKNTALALVQVKVVLEDCGQNGCEDISQDTANIHIGIPAGQSRPFQFQPNFQNLRAVKGELGWRYSVVSAKGEPPNPA